MPTTDIAPPVIDALALDRNGDVHQTACARWRQDPERWKADAWPVAHGCIEQKTIGGYEALAFLACTADVEGAFDILLRGPLRLDEVLSAHDL